MTSPLYGLAAINAVVFGVQGNVQRRMNDPDNLMTHFVAGSVGGLTQSIICGPMELAKTRMQIQGQGESRHRFRVTKHSYTGPVDCMRKIYHTEGFRGVFRGLGLTAARDSPSFSFYFLSFEWMCRKMEPENGGQVGTLGLLFAGGMAGICAWVVTYPIDVMKSKIQADMNNQYKGFTDCCIQSYRQSGLRAFTTGFCSTVLRAFPTNAATFATVSLVLRYMKVDREGDGYYDISVYANNNHPPEAQSHLHFISNFPSHP
jgi:solute carrier family 25 carnitine/acylcarnitine transporter 20/29